MIDGKKLTEINLPMLNNLINPKTMQMISKTVIIDLLKKYNLI